jgi:hypothetical protein
MEAREKYFQRILGWRINRSKAMGSRYISEEVWRDALWTAREQLRSMKAENEDVSRIARKRRQIERIRSAGLADWQERVEWAEFRFPPSSD